MKARVGSVVLVSLLTSVAPAWAQSPAPPPPPTPPTVILFPATAAPLPATPVVAVSPTREEPGPPRLTLRVDSTRPGAVLERRAAVKESVGGFVLLPFKATEATWEPVCVTPCNVSVDRFSTYRVNAQNHISRSGNFTLPQSSDALHLKVKAGNLVAHRTGEVMSGIGVAAVIVGASLLITASDFHHPDNERAAGAITGGLGLVSAAIGIPLALATTSRVHTESDEEIADVYQNHGRRVPLLPDINLGNGFTLTQRGIVF